MASTKLAIIQTPDAGKVIAAASLGTLIEWYDFYLFLNLATIIADRFFPRVHPAVALLFTLGSYAAGIIMRPVGALLFGHRGDRSGRKPAWLLTLSVMGLSTFAMGLVPGYERIGIAAPLIILLLRLLQGLAVGGEFGGAAAYAAEYSPASRRGLFTSWIPLSAMAGLLLSLAAILLARNALDPDRATSLEKFGAWGWRLPFLASIVLVAIAAWFRRKLPETPSFTRLRTEARVPAKPIRQSFTKSNGKILFLAIFGLTLGQGVIASAAGVYVQSFLENQCGIDMDQARSMLLIALVLSGPFYVLSARWSDRLGRKWLMLAGILLAVLTWTLVFGRMPDIAGTAGRTLLADRTEIRNTVSFIDRTRAMLRTSATISYYQDGMRVVEAKTDTVYADGRSSLKPLVSVSRTLPAGDFWKLVAILFGMTWGMAISFGPAAAFLAELFPTSVRYTSLSLCHETGFGFFGGLTPLIAALLTNAYPGKELAGLWYPIGAAILCLATGILFLPGGRKGPQFDFAP